jgi:hypothetical protein
MLIWTDGPPPNFRPAGTDRLAARSRCMGKRNRTPAEILSCTVIGVSLALMAGLALGHITEQSMHPRLSAPLSADPVERYALGQNAYATSNAHLGAVQAQAPVYADTSYEIGRYEKGARILTPSEPARKIERLRLERLQEWNDRSFGADAGFVDERSVKAESAIDDYAPIDVGAVMDAPESAARHAVRQIRTGKSGA